MSSSTESAGDFAKKANTLIDATISIVGVMPNGEMIASLLKMAKTNIEAIIALPVVAPAPAPAPARPVAAVATVAMVEQVVETKAPSPSPSSSPRVGFAQPAVPTPKPQSQVVAASTPAQASTPVPMVNVINVGKKKPTLHLVGSPTVQPQKLPARVPLQVRDPSPLNDEDFDEDGVTHPVQHYEGDEDVEEDDGAYFMGKYEAPEEPVVRPAAKVAAVIMPVPIVMQSMPAKSPTDKAWTVMQSMQPAPVAAPAAPVQPAPTKFVKQSKAEAVVTDVSHFPSLDAAREMPVIKPVPVPVQSRQAYHQAQQIQHARPHHEGGFQLRVREDLHVDPFGINDSGIADIYHAFFELRRAQKAS